MSLVADLDQQRAQAGVGEGAAGAGHHLLLDTIHVDLEVVGEGNSVPLHQRVQRGNQGGDGRAVVTGTGQRAADRTGFLADDAQADQTLVVTHRQAQGTDGIVAAVEEDLADQGVEGEGIGLQRHAAAAARQAGIKAVEAHIGANIEKNFVRRESVDPPDGFGFAEKTVKSPLGALAVEHRQPQLAPADPDRHL